MVCELTFQMGTVTNILLVILSVRCAIVLSQQNSSQVIDGHSSGNTAQSMASIVAEQRQLITKVMEHDAAIERWRRAFRELQTEFDCHFPPCRYCTCIYIINVTNKVYKRRL